MNVLLLANWGIGLEILKTLHRHPDINHVITISRYQPASDDPWINVVYEYSKKIGYKTIIENNILLKDIQQTIETNEIDLMITHAFMKLLPEEIFSAPSKGGINIHPSLLPRHRGPTPTLWVLRNKEPETGLTCHYIDKGIDTGRIVHQVRIPVHVSDTLDSIIEKEKQQIPTLIKASFEKLLDSSFIPQAQDERYASYDPRINENTGMNI